jgi:hypothetical protein
MAQIVAAEYPVGNVQFLAGQVSVELLGRTETFPMTDQPSGFNTGVWWIGQRAREFGRPLRARVASPTQSWMVAVALNGAYEVLGQAPTPVVPESAASQPTPPRIDEDVGFTDEEIAGAGSATRSATTN